MLISGSEPKSGWPRPKHLAGLLAPLQGRASNTASDVEVQDVCCMSIFCRVSSEQSYCYPDLYT